MRSFMLSGLLLVFVIGLALYRAEGGIADLPDVTKNGISPGATQTNLTVDVSMVNFDFDPAVISIQVGDTVKWTNNAAPVPHTTTSGGPFDPAPGSIWDSDTLMAGGSFSFVFTSADDFDYYCTIHPLLMFGTVIVGGSGIKVVLTPDDISSSALSNLGVDVTIFNFTPSDQSGDLWFTVVLPSSQEIDIPVADISLPTNPVSGQVLAGERLDLPVAIFVPLSAPSGHYEVKAKVGSHPSVVVDEDSFGFDVP